MTRAAPSAAPPRATPRAAPRATPRAAPRATPPAERRLHTPQAVELDARPDVLVSRRAARQWGVVSLEELRVCGLAPTAVAVRVRRGSLHPVHRGVYAVGHPVLTLEGCFLAAVRACGAGAVLSHVSAAALHGFVDPEPRPVEVTVPGPGTRIVPGVRVHRSAELGRRDVGRRRGIPVTEPARTLLDLAATKLDDRALRRAVRQAQSLRAVDAGELARAVARAGPRRGMRRLARIIGTGPAPTRSVLEDVVLDLLLRGGLAHPQVNVPLRIGGRLVVPDFRWPRQRLVLEADGAAWHDGPLARDDDAERQALLEAHGERVVRVTWRQAIDRPTQTLARLRAAGVPPAHRASISDA
jgi:very-short-patch-repair endonuclease/predicted transcriptional regulator of viral defense system